MLKLHSWKLERFRSRIYFIFLVLFCFQKKKITPSGPSLAKVSRLLVCAVKFMLLGLVMLRSEDC